MLRFYLRAFYFATCNLTGLGANESPNASIAVIFTLGCFITGVMVFAYLTSGTRHPPFSYPSPSAFFHLPSPRNCECSACLHDLSSVSRHHVPDTLSPVLRVCALAQPSSRL